jgi:ribosome recycling factor
VKELAENARIAIRNIRRDANGDLKSLEKDKDISEDDEHKGQELVQQTTNQSTDEIESLLQIKEKELMQI